MPVPSDDLAFESYLKGFQPVPPAPLPPARRGWSRLWLAAAAAVLVVLGVTLSVDRGVVVKGTTPDLLTLGDANVLLAGSPSPNAVFDELAFSRRAAALHPGTRSAIEVLSQEGLR